MFQSQYLLLSWKQRPSRNWPKLRTNPVRLHCKVLSVFSLSAQCLSVFSRTLLLCTDCFVDLVVASGTARHEIPGRAKCNLVFLSENEHYQPVVCQIVLKNIVRELVYQKDVLGYLYVLVSDFFLESPRTENSKGNSVIIE